jgi:hypothetical protein
MAAVFAYNALCFVPLGHLVSRLMRRIEKLPSYSWNLVGSLAGIAVFYLLSYLWTPPLVWLAVLGVGLAPFMLRPLKSLVPTGLALVIGVGILSLSFRQYETDIFSPYQILTLNEQPGTPVEIRVNNVYYQRMLDLASQRPSADDAEFNWRDHYDLPYHFTEPGARVLIVGSGTGNDVAAAVRNGAGPVDAVEIDPAILMFGEQLHPAAPYQAENVTSHVADARAFIRRANDRYDLIVYGLLDSHTLLSGLSGVRLDSYVYTVEGFREARSEGRRTHSLDLQRDRFRAGAKALHDAGAGIRRSAAARAEYGVRSWVHVPGRRNDGPARTAASGRAQRRYACLRFA